MKKIFLAALVLLSVATTNAQKGSILLYGDIGFNTNSNGGSPLASTNTNGGAGSFSINPGVGYQF